MSYEIQAMVGKAGTMIRAESYGLSVVSLRAGLEMIPLPKTVRSQFGIKFCPLTDEGCQEVPHELDRLCCEVSEGCEVAYIEAEIFGGEGTQAFSLYRNGSLVSGPVIDTFAINEALIALGVESTVPERDEFDVVGLGRHRSTEQWC